MNLPLHPVLKGIFGWLQVIWALLVLSVGASAHTGFENSTEVRIFPERVQIVVRTSVALAWRILGEQAPAQADEAAQVVAQPLLEIAAPGMVEVSAVGNRMTPDVVKCQFEINEDVAFVLTYPRPSQWPMTVNARFLRHLGSLDSGTISIFDQTADPFSREVEPIIGKVISANDSSLSFSPAGEAAPATGKTKPLALDSPRWRPVLGIPAVALLVAALGACWLVRRNFRSH